MLRCVKNGRPVPIFNTVDLCCRVKNFKPKDYIMCVNPNLLKLVATNSPGFISMN